MTRRARRWLDAWGPMLPMFVAEGTIWVGFGALLPILPIYFTQHGVDLPTLGIVVAAWPAARLIGEPLFGWIADSGPRKAMMVIGLFAPRFRSRAAVRGRAGVVASSARWPGCRPRCTTRRPRLPRRRQPARAPRRAVRAVRRRADGRADVGPAIGGIAAGLTGSPTVVFWVRGRCSCARVGRAGPSAHRTRPRPAKHATRRRPRNDAPEPRCGALHGSQPGADRRASCSTSAATSPAARTRWSGACTSRPRGEPRADRRSRSSRSPSRSSCCRPGSGSSSTARAASRARHRDGRVGICGLLYPVVPRSGSWPLGHRRGHGVRAGVACAVPAGGAGPRRPGAARRRRASSAPRGPSGRSSPPSRPGRWPA